MVNQSSRKPSIKNGTTHGKSPRARYALFRQLTAFIANLMASSSEHFDDETNRPGERCINQTASAKDFDELSNSVDKTMEAIDIIMHGNKEQAELCQFHEHQVQPAAYDTTGLRPMIRFLLEDATTQCSVMGLQDGTLSITKPCNCAVILCGRMPISAEQLGDASKSRRGHISGSEIAMNDK